MKARFLRTEALESLRHNIQKNISLYREGDFSDLAVDISNWFEVDIEVDEEKLKELKDPEGSELFEVENCITAMQAFPQLAPYQARDERLWTYLTHTILLEHTRKRWPIPDDDAEAVGYIRNHFFAGDKRGIERNNSISRLWWMAHLCSRVNAVELEATLEAFLFRSDVRANIIERPTTSQSVPVFSALLKKLSQSYKGRQRLFERQIFRDFMAEINSVGGSRLLDCLDTDQAEKILDDIIKNRLALNAI